MLMHFSGLILENIAENPDESEEDTGNFHGHDLLVRLSATAFRLTHACHALFRTLGFPLIVKLTDACVK